ncbi:hypothetical protein [Paenibacillus xylanexedens]|uniref:hypothetical protein n=1 Tax=Paenibacillus xylanexedens TaxID=528191 RepID=UPI000F530C6D|nr:hypothetical protein [Paenibacillus xylanexedens]RPK20038.1 hypothetical protein EDO6_06555 [Paenibacillus xylanexedens]
MLSKNKERKLVELYPHTDDADIAKILGVSLWMVKKVAEGLGLEKESVREWTRREIDYLTAHYATTANAELARAFDRSKMEIEHFAFRMGLSKSKGFFVNIVNTPEEMELVKQWNDEYNKQDFGYSRGNHVLGKILEHLFPYSNVTSEYPIGNLRLDFYIQRVSLGFEFDGIQHREFNNHFYETKADFAKAQVRDYRKSELCESMGIAIVRFDDTEKLSFGLVKRKIEEAM